MRAYLLSLFLLGLVAFSLATTLEPWFQSWEGNRAHSQNVLQVALGDSRRMFARHFFVKADAYFHKGYHPSVFDNKEGFDEKAVSGQEAGQSQEKCEGDFLGKPHDWIDAFGRHFYPSVHTHVGDEPCTHEGCNHEHDDGDHEHDHKHEHGEECDHESHKDGKRAGIEREILPWLRLSAAMDPQRIETYTVAAFWLRGEIGNAAAAEQFLREGLRANPGDPEILFGLGSIYFENHKDIERARNVLELSFMQWREREARKSEPNRLLAGQILNQLALLERQEGNNARAIQHYTALKQVSPSKQSIQEWIDYLTTNSPPPSSVLKP